jgi:DKNYY family
MNANNYYLQDGRVRWRQYEVKGADPATFEELGRFWGRDAERVYTQNSVNRLADRNTFEVLNFLYAKDKDHAFYLSGIIKEADAATFRVLDAGRHPRPGWPAPAEDNDSGWAFEGFACDATQVFHYVMTIGKPCVLRGVDPATFEVLPHSYGRDAKSVYFEKYRLKGARPQSFRQLNQHFAVDDHSVFYGERAIAGADAASFEIFGEYWAKDANCVYFQDNQVQADRASIELIAHYFARDGEKVFGFGGKVLEGADPLSFQPAGGLYFKDWARVYYIGYPGGWVEGADAGTFQVVQDGRSDARDSRHCYRNGKRL